MAKLTKEERLERLREIIEQHRTLSTSELQDVLNVSRMTLFRDLETLQQQGFIERLYGSVTLTRSLYDIDESLGANIEEKRSIAQQAITLINQDDAVFLGAGTTVLEVAKAITSSDICITAFTNSLPVANVVNRSSNVRLFMAGGEYHPDTQSLVGPITLKSIEGVSGRLLFFGANGVDIKAGITSYFADQAELLRQMMNACNISVAVIDSSKFGRINIHRVCQLKEVDYLITDSNLDPTIQEEIISEGIPLIVTSKLATSEENIFVGPNGS